MLSAAKFFRKEKQKIESIKLICTTEFVPTTISVNQVLLRVTRLSVTKNLRFFLKLKYVSCFKAEDNLLYINISKLSGDFLEY